MIYLSSLLGLSVYDAQREKLGSLSDLIITTGEAFPRVTGLVFREGDAPPSMLSWRKYVTTLDKDGLFLNIPKSKIRFSYLQPDEILLVRDVLNRSIVDTQHKKVVKATDAKFSGARNQLRLLGAEVGPRGALRSVSPRLESAVARLTEIFGRPLEETIISWSYIDLLEDSAGVRSFSAAHKRLTELHPADLADVVEQLDETQRVRIFEQLNDEAAAETLAELEDEIQLEVICGMEEARAVALLNEMDPDDAADVIRSLPADKSLVLLARMNPEDAKEVSDLLGYAEKTAGSVMTSEVASVIEGGTVDDALEFLREISEERESIHYIYVTDTDGHLTGVVSLRALLTADAETPLAELTETDLITAAPDDDQREVADAISKYGLLAIPVIDEHGVLLGIVTVDDAMEVLEEEKAEEFELATGGSSTVGKGRKGLSSPGERLLWFVNRNIWVAFWALACLVLAWLVSPTTASVLLPSLILLPVVLIIGDDVISSVKSDLLAQSEPRERGSLPWIVLRELTVGIALSLILVAVFTALFSLFFLAAGRPETLSAVVTLTLPTAIAVPLTLLAGVALGELLRARYERTDSISGTFFSVTMMTVATILQVGAALVLSAFNPFLLL